MVVAALALAGPIHAEPTQCTDVDLAKKVDALQRDVTSLKLTLAETLKAEERRIEILRALLLDAAAQKPAPVPAPIPTPSPSPSPVTAPPPPPPPVPRGSGEIVGRVDFPDGVGPEAWVFVEDIVEPAIENATATLKQEAMKFVPRNQVIRKGTLVRFPNLDDIEHNVFSYTPRNNFNLGKYSRLEAPRTYRFLVPARVEVFCDIHADMTATILVVPNSYYVRVKDDGSFVIKNVPKGKHTVTAWGARANLISIRNVEVKANQATEPLSFTLQRGHDPYNQKTKRRYQ